MSDTNAATRHGIPDVADPLPLFAAWLAEAGRQELNDPNAMALATSTPDGRPSVRMVLLKGHDDQGFVFYTNQQSRKGEEAQANPRAALLFHWKSLRRQVRVEGPLQPVSDAEAGRLLQQPGTGVAAGGGGVRPVAAVAWAGGAGTPGRGPGRALSRGHHPAAGRTGPGSGWRRSESSSGRTCRSACTTAAFSRAQPTDGRPARFTRDRAGAWASVRSSVRSGASATQDAMMLPGCLIGIECHAYPQDIVAAGRRRCRGGGVGHGADGRAHLGRPRHRVARARGQPGRGAAGRGGPVGGDDRGDDGGDREGERRPQRRGARNVRSVRGAAWGDGRRAAPGRWGHGELRQHHGAGGRPGGPACTADGCHGRAAPRGGRRREQQQRAPRGAVRQRGGRC